MTLMAAVTGLDLSVRIAIFAVAHVVVYAWTRYVVAPGSPGRDRLWRALPLLPALLCLGCLFRSDIPDEALLALVNNANFLWLVPFKIWCLAMNRGQLVKSYDSGRNAAFALGLLATVTIAFEEKPVDKDKIDESKEKHAYKDVRFDIIQFKGRAFFAEAASFVGRLLAKVALMYVMRKGYYYFRDADQFFWSDVCLGWSFYGTTAYVQDLYGLIILLTFNLKLATNFDKPFVAQSMQELWSRRYNLVMGESFRDLIFDPICEKRWIRGSTYHAARSSSPLRRTIAILLTFAASGAIHAFVVWFAMPERIPMSMCFFFVACALVVIAENAIKEFLKASGYFEVAARLVPAWARVVYMQSVLFSLAHLFFWRDFHAIGLGGLAVDFVLYSLRLI